MRNDDATARPFPSPSGRPGGAGGPDGLLAVGAILARHGGLRVVVTFPALDSFARKTAGDHATVQCLYEGPVEDVEDFEPSPEDAALLRRADLLFINGLGLDDEFTQRLRINGNPICNPSPSASWSRRATAAATANPTRTSGSASSRPSSWSTASATLSKGRPAERRRLRRERRSLY